MNTSKIFKSPPEPKPQRPSARDIMRYMERLEEEAVRFINEEAAREEDLYTHGLKTFGEDPVGS